MTKIDLNWTCPRKK